MYTKAIRYVGGLILVFLAGCALPIDDSGGEPVGSASAEIMREISGGVAEVMGRRYTRDPGRTLASYATAQLSNCSATMIGPNFMITAGHCGRTQDRNLTFKTYRDGRISGAQSETFKCDHILAAYNDTDLAIYYCEPNASGVSPGDRFGWLEFDTSSPQVDQGVYSVWSNPVKDFTDPNAAHMIYSEGRVTATDVKGWYTPGPEDDGLPIGIKTNLWTFSGASGSTQLSTATDRILIGPTSTGGTTNADGDAAEAANRRAMSIRDYLLRGRVDSDADDMNSTLISSFGLTPADYRGSVDEDRDWLLDIQEDVERARGENRRDFYWLDFDSARRRNLWGRSVNATINDGYAEVKSTTGTGLLLRHRYLNLPAGTWLVHAFVNTRSAGTANALTVQLKNGSTVLSQASLRTVSGQSGHQAVRLTSTIDNAWLDISASGPVDATIRDVLVVREGTPLDFDTHDQRSHWYNPETGDRAFILPDGNESGVRWAGRVYRRTASSTTEYTLRTRNYPFIPFEDYAMCFKARAVGTSSGRNWGRAEIRNGGATGAVIEFAVSSEWSTHCITSFSARGDTEVVFGIKGLETFGDADEVRNRQYLVDQIRIVRSFIR